jgi:hypothetical protein
LVKARVEAMRVAKANQPLGRGYNTHMHGLLAEYQLDDMGETARAYLLKIMDNLQDVEVWRLKQDNPDDFNHPTVVWRKYQRSLKQKDERDDDKRQKGRRLAKETNEELAAAQERIKELEEELASAQASNGNGKRKSSYEVGLESEVEELKAALAGGGDPITACIVALKAMDKQERVVAVERLARAIGELDAKAAAKAAKPKGKTPKGKGKQGKVARVQRAGAAT